MPFQKSDKIEKLSQDYRVSTTVQSALDDTSTASTTPFSKEITTTKEFFDQNSTTKLVKEESKYFDFFVLSLVINIYFVVLIAVYLTAYFIKPSNALKGTKIADDITIVWIPPEEIDANPIIDVVEVNIPSVVVNILPESFLDLSTDLIPIANSTVIKRPAELAATHSWVWNSVDFTEDSSLFKL